MEEKRSSGRSKKPAKQPDEGAWDCSVCTYKNSAEAYKCEMCDVRKGTSTRKPKINPQIVAQQVAQQFAAPLTPPPGSPIPDEEGLNLEPVVHQPIEMLGPPPLPPKVAVKKEVPKREKTKITPKPDKVFTTQQKPKKQRQLHLFCTDPSINVIDELRKKLRTHILSGSNFRNIDRSTARHMSVTVDNVTVVITDYQPKKRKISMETTKNTVQSDVSDSSSNASNDIHDEHSHMENHT